MAPVAIQNRQKPRRQTPQETVQRFWDRLNSKYSGKVLTVLPNNPYVRRRAARTPHGVLHGQRAVKSYDEARAECIRDVDRIIKECQRLNQKYRDLHFDIESDLKSGQRNCLDGLGTPGDKMKPKGVKRVTVSELNSGPNMQKDEVLMTFQDMFENPQFFINGPTAGDVRQGRLGDCYLMAALCGLGNMEGLIDKVCVKQNQDVGVYGFVFYRDGEWQHHLVDDKLYLRQPDYDEAVGERETWDDINRVDSEEEYRKTYQMGSRALYFAQCSEDNETWLPLLEKAYAKAHGDFASIDGGFTGEAIEDLTGGVTTEIYSTDILDREKFWKDELMQVGKSFLFGCTTGFYSDWLDTTGAPRERQGITEGHAYSIMEAREVKDERLLKLRNPWGNKEWTGKWSDGSSDWTPEWMQLLDHKFGNDGVFWISYDDLLKKYQQFDRTRIFGPEWNVTQCWTSVSVSWSPDYNSTRFSLTLDQKAPVVIVLAQLDETYFAGLEGAYDFDLQFRLKSADRKDENEYIVQSNGNYARARSVSTDIELDAGTYAVLMKITATRHTDLKHLEDVLPVYAATRREKLIRMGLSYDLAHAKGVVVETEAEKRARRDRRKARKAENREVQKKKAEAQAKKYWRKEKERHKREKERNARNKERRERKQRADAHKVLQEAAEGEAGTRPINGVWLGPLDGQSPEHIRSVIKQVSGISRMKDGGVGGDASGPVETGKKLSTRIVRIEPIHAEAIVHGKKDDRGDTTSEEQSRPEGTPTSHEENEGKLKEEPAAAKLVEPLEDVIKIADAESQANQPENDVSVADLDRPAQSNAENEVDAPAQHEQPPSTHTASPDTTVSVNDAAGAIVTDIKPMANRPPLSRPEHDEIIVSNISHENAIDDGRGPLQYDFRDGTSWKTHNGLVEIWSLDIQKEGDAGGAGPGRGLDSKSDSTSDSDDSFPPFDWNADLDMPSELSSSESSSESSSPSRRPKLGLQPDGGRRRGSGGDGGGRGTGPGRGRGGTGGLASSPPPDFDRTSGDDGDGSGGEQWNAVCVVGLRVYSTLGGEGVKLKVVRRRGSDDESDTDDDPPPMTGHKTHPEHQTPAKETTTLDPDDGSKGAVAMLPESTGVGGQKAQSPVPKMKNKSAE